MKSNINDSYRSYLRIISIVIVFTVLNSCTDNFIEYNTDKSQLMEVGNKELGALFSRSQAEGCTWLSTDNYSRMSSTAANHFSGYTACGITNQEINIMRTGWQNAGFNRIYTNSYAALKNIIELTEEDNIAAHSVAVIWKVFLMHRMTDLWGPIPYTEAGSGNESVPYESQKDVYYKMLDELASSVSLLATELENNSDLNVFGAGDMIYNGDPSKWIKFGNTLRLRLAIRISNIDPDKAKIEAEKAATGNIMNSNDDDALVDVTYWSSGGNGMPRMESFNQDVMSASMESVLKGYNDPRISEFFSPVEYNEVIEYPGYPDELKAHVGGYHGISNGFDPSLVNYFKSFSKYGSRFVDGNQLITPINIMNSAETYFLKAEGAWRGWNMGGTAQSFYEKGIEVSIKQWRGNDISEDSIQRYISSTLIPIAPDNYPYYDPAMTDVPVKFSSDQTEQYEQIMTQKWLALFPISFEAWAEYRRTRLPKIYAKKNSGNANINPTIGQIVTRFPFTDSEKNTQPDEIEKAIDLLGGEDLESTPLWWDVNSNGN